MLIRMEYTSQLEENIIIPHLERAIQKGRGEDAVVVLVLIPLMTIWASRSFFFFFFLNRFE